MPHWSLRTTVVFERAPHAGLSSLMSANKPLMASQCRVLETRERKWSTIQRAKARCGMQAFHLEWRKRSIPTHSERFDSPIFNTKIDKKRLKKRSIIVHLYLSRAFLRSFFLRLNPFFSLFCSTMALHLNRMRIQSRALHWFFMTWKKSMTLASQPLHPRTISMEQKFCDQEFLMR